MKNPGIITAGGLHGNNQQNNLNGLEHLFLPPHHFEKGISWIMSILCCFWETHLLLLFIKWQVAYIHMDWVPAGSSSWIWDVFNVTAWAWVLCIHTWCGLYSGEEFQPPLPPKSDLIWGVLWAQSIPNLLTACQQRRRSVSMATPISLRCTVCPQLPGARSISLRGPLARPTLSPEPGSLYSIPACSPSWKLCPRLACSAKDSGVTGWLRNTRFSLPAVCLWWNRSP